MTVPPTPDDGWNAVPPETLTRAADRARRRDRVRRDTWIGLGLAAVLVVVAVPWMFGLIGTAREYDFGGITCSEVHEVLPAYQEGTLEDETARQVAFHVDKCPRCSELVRSMMQDSQACIVGEHRHGCDCPDHTAGLEEPVALLSSTRPGSSLLLVAP